MPHGGKKSKLTPERQKKIVDALSAGNYFEVACEYAGITPACGYEWLQRGRGEHPTQKQLPIYVEFVDAVRRAQAEDEVHTIARLKKAGQGGDLIEETIYKEPDIIKFDGEGHELERRIGKQRTVRRYAVPETQSDQWRMERKHYQRWGRKEVQKISEFNGHGSALPVIAGQPTFGVMVVPGMLTAEQWQQQAQQHYEQQRLRDDTTNGGTADRP